MEWLLDRGVRGPTYARASVGRQGKKLIIFLKYVFVTGNFDFVVGCFAVD